MSKPKLQAFAKRYVAEMIANDLPNELDFAGEEFTPKDRIAVYRLLEGLRLRLVIEAELLDSLPLTHRHPNEASSAPGR